MNKRRSAIIVGGGFAGLAAGYDLQKAGWQVTLCEASDSVGGRVATVRRDGYTLDTGATQMSTGYHQYLALCSDLGLRERMIPSSSWVGVIRHGRIHLINGESVLSGPLSSLLSLRSKWVMTRTLKDLLSLKPKVDPRDVSANHAVDVESARDYALRRLNPEIYDALVDPLLRAYVMNRAENVSALEWFSTLRILGGQTMLSMCGGNDTLPKALAGTFDVRLSTRVVAVRREADGVQVECQRADGMHETLRADTSVLAARLPEILTMYPPAREFASSLNARLRYNRGLVMQLGYRRKPACPAVGLLLGTVEHPQIGLIWLEHNKNADRAPQGHALFSVYGDEAAVDGMEHLPDAALIELAAAYVEKLFPELRGQRDLAHVTRWPMAVPNPAPGLYREMHAMKSRLDPKDRVQLAGDFLTCVGQNSAIHYGRVAAANLIGTAGSAASCTRTDPAVARTQHA